MMTILIIAISYIAVVLLVLRIFHALRDRNVPEVEYFNEETVYITDRMPLRSEPPSNKTAGRKALCLN